MSEVIQPATSPDVDWPTTNCYIDAWIGILADWGCEPAAALGVTVTQDYEGDQFTFFKYPQHDLEVLFGILVSELSIYRSLETQIAEQVDLGRLILVEVDGYYLPDTRATSYRTQHSKTTIGVDRIDAARGWLSYYHNVGHHELTGIDYAGVFRKLPHQDSEDLLPPYVEFVQRRFPPRTGAALVDCAIALLRQHLRRRPADNPIARCRQDFARRMDELLAQPDRFHEYAFNNYRQLGANFQLLAQHLDWLGAQGVDGLCAAREAAARMSSTAKAMQFKVARIAARQRFDPCEALFDTLERNYEQAVVRLEGALP